MSSSTPCERTLAFRDFRLTAWGSASHSSAPSYHTCTQTLSSYNANKVLRRYIWSWRRCRLGKIEVGCVDDCHSIEDDDYVTVLHDHRMSLPKQTNTRGDVNVPLVKGLSQMEQKYTAGDADESWRWVCIKLVGFIFESIQWCNTSGRFCWSEIQQPHRQDKSDMSSTDIWAAAGVDS